MAILMLNSYFGNNPFYVEHIFLNRSKSAMVKRLRIRYPGTYYHMMNRGYRREDIFITDNDRATVLMD